MVYERGMTDRFRKRLSHGVNVMRRTTYGRQGPWMRCRNDAPGGRNPPGTNRELRTLDALAHRKVAPMGVHGLVIRKAAR